VVERRLSRFQLYLGFTFGPPDFSCTVHSTFFCGEH